ncbi:MAG: transposase [Williamsia sp.]|nr:transposase [Williamsia sp.]
MAKTNVKLSLKPRRIFSEKLKRKIVKDIEQGKVNVTGVCREYEVSNVSVYVWLKKFSSHLHSSSTLVMQMDSEQYRTKELEKKVAELEAALGRKQLEIEYLNKLIDIASRDLAVDLKKISIRVHQVVSAEQRTKKIYLEGPVCIFSRK